MTESLHLGDHSSRVVVEEIKPQHQPIIRMKPLLDLGLFLRIANHSVVCCTFNLGGIERPFNAVQYAPKAERASACARSLRCAGLKPSSSFRKTMTVRGIWGFHGPPSG